MLIVGQEAAEQRVKAGPLRYYARTPTVVSTFIIATVFIGCRERGFICYDLITAWRSISMTLWRCVRCMQHLLVLPERAECVSASVSVERNPYLQLKRACIQNPSNIAEGFAMRVSVHLLMTIISVRRTALRFCQGSQTCMACARIIDIRSECRRCWMMQE